MTLKILIISKYKWKTRLRKHEQIKQLMMQGGFSEIIIKMIHVDIGKPDMKDGRITEAWYEKNVTKRARQEDCDYAVFQFSKKDGKKWGIKQGLHGSNFRDGDGFGESWVCCDENTVWKFKDGSTWNEYCKSVPHEIGHELTRSGYTTLEVHDYDYKTTLNNLRQFYKDINKKMKWAKYLPEPYFSNVTQGFAVPNPLYKVSKHHLGVDHGVQGIPDVPIYMPCDGRITRHIIDDTLGNCAVILSKDENWAFRIAHMKDRPKPVGEYLAGERIGTVGNIGLSDALHCHIDAWKDGIINIAKIKDRESILKYCVDAHELVTKNI